MENKNEWIELGQIEHYGSCNSGTDCRTTTLYCKHIEGYGMHFAVGPDKKVVRRCKNAYVGEYNATFGDQRYFDLDYFDRKEN